GRGVSRRSIELGKTKGVEDHVFPGNENLGEVNSATEQLILATRNGLVVVPDLHMAERNLASKIKCDFRIQVKLIFRNIAKFSLIEPHPSGRVDRMCVADAHAGITDRSFGWPAKIRDVARNMLNRDWQRQRTD